jgi:hypothetical protein
MRPCTRAIQPGLFALASWLFAAIPSPSIQEWLPPNRYEFGLPRVCVPYTPGTDVVSLVPDLFSALTIVCLCLLLSEVAKIMSTVLPGRRIAFYVAFSIYQATLVIDVLRRFSWDWYGYLLYFARLTKLSYNRPQPEVLPIPSPWLSLLALLACTVLYISNLRTQQPR